MTGWTPTTPERWPVHRADELFTIVSGSTPRTSVPENWGGGIVWVTPDDQDHGAVDTLLSGRRTITQSGFDSCSTTMVPKGSVLLSSRAPIGYVSVAGREMCTNQGFKTFVAKDGFEMEPKFLMWWLRASRPQLEALGSGTTFKELSKRAASTIPIPVPTLDEQRAIIETIERTLSRVDAAQAMMAAGKARLLAAEKAIIRRVLDDIGELPETRWVTWGDVGSTLSGKAFPSTAYQDSGVPLLRPGNLASTGHITWASSATRFLPEHYADEHSKYLLQGRVLLMNLTAQSLADDFLGRVCLSAPSDRFLLNQRIAELSSSLASSDYLYWIFRSPSFRRFIGKANTGSLIQHISTKALNDFAFPLPSPDLQGAVVAELERAISKTRQVDEAITISEARAEALRRSVLKAAFEGRLTRDAADFSLQDFERVPA